MIVDSLMLRFDKVQLRGEATFDVGRTRQYLRDPLRQEQPGFKLQIKQIFLINIQNTQDMQWPLRFHITNDLI